MKKRVFRTIVALSIVCMFGFDALNVCAANLGFFITNDDLKQDAGTGEYIAEKYAPLHVADIEIDEETTSIVLPEEGQQLEITETQAEALIGEFDKAISDNVNVSDDGKYSLIELELYDDNDELLPQTLIYDLSDVSWYVIKNSGEDTYRVIGYANSFEFKNQTYNVEILDQEGNTVTTIETKTGRYPVVPAEVLTAAAQEGKTLAWSVDGSDATFTIGEDGVIPSIVMEDVTYAPVYTDVVVDDDDDNNGGNDDNNGGNDDNNGGNDDNNGGNDDNNGGNNDNNGGNQSTDDNNGGNGGNNDVVDDNNNNNNQETDNNNGGNQPGGQPENQNPGPAPAEDNQVGGITDNSNNGGQNPTTQTPVVQTPVAQNPANQIPAAQVAPANNQPAAVVAQANADDADDQAEIEDEGTPLADNEEETVAEDKETLEIADEDTPLASSVEENVVCYLHWLVLVLTLAYVVFEVVLFVKRKEELN